MPIPDKLPDSKNETALLVTVAALAFLAAIAKFVFDAGEKPIYWRMMLVSGVMGSFVGMVVYSMLASKITIEGLGAVAIGIMCGFFFKYVLNRLGYLTRKISDKYLGGGEASDDKAK